MNDEKAKKIRDALAGWKTGQYQSVSACAEYFQVPRTTLRDMIVDPRTVHSWFELTKERLLNDPELAECWKDPRRIFNQDETSLCVGSEHEKVLAPVGYHRPVYNLGGDSRAHTSISTIISAHGKYVG